jgi:hypothetical protein
MDLAKEAIETLKAARFPIFAVPPSRWNGDVMVRGVRGGTNHPLSIKISYDDDLAVERPERQIAIISTGAEGMIKRHPAEAFLLHEASYNTELANFVENIVRDRLRRSEHGSPLAGARKPLAAVAHSEGTWIERTAFEEHPELRLYRIQTPRVEVLVLGWNWDDEALRESTRLCRPIQEDASLFAEIERAEYAAWEKINTRL